ncbi:transposase, partial [Chloroflexota bacterium]
YGSYNGIQRYMCKICHRKFKGDDTLFHMKVSPEFISTAMELYYTGSSIDDISQHFRNTKGYHPSKSVVFGWVDKYTDKMVKYFRQYQPQVGDTWVCDETVLRLDKNKKVWFWDIIDTKTRYLIATRVSTSRTTGDAQKLMEKARRVTGKTPKKIITDKLYAYWDGIELTFGGDTEHVQSSPFAHGDSTSQIERWHSTLKERTKVMKAFRNTETLIQFTDGFQAYYNYLKPHHTLKGKTPAEVAGVDYNEKTWDAVCRLPVAKEKVIRRKSSEVKFKRPVIKAQSEPNLGKPHYSRKWGGMTRKGG